MYLNLPKYPRYVTAALGSAFVTGGLVLMMVQLVAVDDLAIVESPQYPITDFVRVPEDEPEPARKRVVEKPPIVDEEPPPPEMMVASNDSGGVGVNFTPPVSSRPGLGALPRVTDGEQIPLVKVTPQYPRTAASRGIEGYVILSFTITPTGATADAVVVESQPGGVFDRSAINAVRKFKYRPKVVNGEPQSVYDVQHRLTYEIANG